MSQSPSEQQIVERQKLIAESLNLLPEFMVESRKRFDSIDKTLEGFNKFAERLTNVITEAELRAKQQQSVSPSAAQQTMQQTLPMGQMSQMSGGMGRPDSSFDPLGVNNQMQMGGGGGMTGNPLVDNILGMVFQDVSKGITGAPAAGTDFSKFFMELAMKSFTEDYQLASEIRRQIRNKLVGQVVSDVSRDIGVKASGQQQSGQSNQQSAVPSQPAAASPA